MKKMHYKRILGLFILLFIFLATSPIDVAAESKTDACKWLYSNGSANIPNRYGIKIDINKKGQIEVSMNNSSPSKSGIKVEDIKFTVSRLSTFKGYDDSKESLEEAIDYTGSKYFTKSDDIKKFAENGNITLTPSGKVIINRTGDLASQNGIEVALKPEFTDSFISSKIKTCKPKKEQRYHDGWYAQVFMDIQGSGGEGSYQIKIGEDTSTDSKSGKIDCSKYNYDNGYHDGDSLDYKFCYAKNNAKDKNKYDFTKVYTNDASLGKVYSDYKDKKLSPFTCKEKSILNNSQEVLNKTLNGENVSADKYYTEDNRDYIYGYTDIKKTVGEYIYNYETEKPDSEPAECKLRCEEAVIVEYGPPVASEAGLCFGYKVKLTSIVSCEQIEKVNPPKTDYKWDIPFPVCYHVGGGASNQGGPNDSFDSCVNSCDNGKYTEKCVSKCYNSVYGNKINKTSGDLALNYNAKKLADGDAEFDNNGIMKDPKYKYSGDELIWSVSNVVSHDRLGHPLRNHSSCSSGNHYATGAGTFNYDCKTDAPWHRRNSWGFNGGYTIYSGSGIPKTEICNDTCKWKTTTNNKYLNEAQAQKDAEENLKKYEELKTACTAAASCTTTTAEFSIAVTTDGKEITDSTATRINFPYTENNAKNKDKITSHGTKDVTNTSTNDNTTILKYDGCYKDENAKKWYQTEWTFPGTWISNKTKKISYTPINKPGYRFYDGLFCIPRNAKDVNEKWWYFYYANKIDWLTPQYSVSDNNYLTKISECSNSNSNNCNYGDYKDYDKVKNMKKKTVWNIGAESEKFGYFGWNISIKCFYALTSKTCPNPDNETSNKVKCPVGEPTSGYRIRTVDLENLFPDKDGNKLSNSESTGRSPGFNWSSHATQTVKDSDYTSTPVAYTKWIQTTGNKVYTDNNIDYQIVLTKDMINEIKNKVKDSGFNYSNIDSAAEVKVDSVTHYVSNYIREHGTIYPNKSDKTFKCNNIAPGKRGAGFDTGCQVFE